MSSGKVVPRLTIVAPINTSGMPVILATHAAESINQSPPLIMNSRPTIKREQVIIIVILPSFFTKYFVLLSGLYMIQNINIYVIYCEKRM